jgi:hypothetical protein
MWQDITNATQKAFKLAYCLQIQSETVDVIQGTYYHYFFLSLTIQVRSNLLKLVQANNNNNRGVFFCLTATQANKQQQPRSVFCLTATQANKHTPHKE